MTILLQRFPIIMQVIGLFGVLLAIYPAVFAAGTGSCAGNMPTSTVAQCKNQRCTFFFTGFSSSKTSMGKFVKGSKR